MTVKLNGVTIKTTQKSYVKGYGEVWFDERSITNILALENVKNKFRVTYDSNNDVFLRLHKPSGKDVYFNMNKDRLYYHDTKNWNVTLVQSVIKNKSGYRQCQLKSDKLAREIYAKFGHPSNNCFKKIIKSNLISNCLVYWAINHTVLIGRFNLPTVFKYQHQNIRHLWIYY